MVSSEYLRWSWIRVCSAIMQVFGVLFILLDFSVSRWRDCLPPAMLLIVVSVLASFAKRKLRELNETQLTTEPTDK